MSDGTRRPRTVFCESCRRSFRAARGCPPCPSCGSEDTFAEKDGGWPCAARDCEVNRYGPDEKINRGERRRACRNGEGPVRGPWRSPT